MDRANFQGTAPFGLIGWAHHYYSQPDTYSDLWLIIINVAGVGVFVTKAMIIVFVQMWLRWTLPRPRIDQVLYACVKVLLPITCVLLLGAALWQLLVPDLAGIPWQDYQPWNFAQWHEKGATASLITQLVLTLGGLGLFGSIVLWIIYAAATGRNLKQRLTDPAPFPEEVAAPAPQPASA